MKRILIFIFAIVICSICVSHCDAQTRTFVYNFEKITAADTVTHELQFVSTQILYNAPQLVYIIVDADNTGTIQFAVAEQDATLPIRSRFQSYTAGEKIPISIRNGRVNLYYKASAASNAFSITN